jgi:hypothetical protein
MAAPVASAPRVAAPLRCLGSSRALQSPACPAASSLAAARAGAGCTTSAAGSVLAGSACHRAASAARLLRGARAASRAASARSTVCAAAVADAPEETYQYQAEVRSAQ